MAPTKVVEVRYDHFSEDRFRHGCTFVRVREDKLPKDCLLEQVVEHVAIQNMEDLIEARLVSRCTKFSIPENGAFHDLPPAISIRQVGFCKRCHTRPQFCFDTVLNGVFAMWCQCCIVTGPLADFIRPDNSEDWTRLVLDEVDATNALKAKGTLRTAK